MSCDVHKNRSVATGAYSLNGHDSSHIMSATKALLKVPTLGHKTTYIQLTDFQIPACQNTSQVFLFWDCMTFLSKLSLAISLLKLSSLILILILIYCIHIVTYATLDFSRSINPKFTIHDITRLLYTVMIVVITKF